MAHYITVEEVLTEYKTRIASAGSTSRMKCINMHILLTKQETDIVFEVNLNGKKTVHNELKDAVDKYNSIP